MRDLERPFLKQTNKQQKQNWKRKSYLQFYRTLWPRGMQGRGFYNVSESTDLACDLWISECMSDKTSDCNENHFWGISEKEVFSQEAQYLAVWFFLCVCVRVCVINTGIHDLGNGMGSEHLSKHFSLSSWVSITSNYFFRIRNLVCTS